MRNRKINVIPSLSKGIGISEYDIFIGQSGFEERSRYVAERLSPNADHKYAIAFDSRKVHDYERNCEFYGAHKYTIRECSDADLGAYYAEILDVQPKTGKDVVRICYDISSASRFRLAQFILSAMNMKAPVVEIDFVYALAEFVAPSKRIEPIKSFGPISSQFCGWTDDPNRNLVMLVGLGYEYDRAIGAIENLEPSAVWVFVPTGHNKKYSNAIRRSNDGLWEIVDRKRIIEYDIFSPFYTFVRLESFVYGAMNSERVVLVPFGPKMFSLLCLLVGSIHDRVSVWRVTSAEYGDPLNVVASGKVVSISARFDSRGASD